MEEQFQNVVLDFWFEIQFVYCAVVIIDLIHFPNEHYGAINPESQTNLLQLILALNS